MLEEPIFDTLSCNKDVLLASTFQLLDFFFKHVKHIVIFTSSGNMCILKQVCYCLPCISYLTLETYVLILKGLYLIFTIHNGLLQLCCLFTMLCLYPTDGLLMNLLHTVCNLLSNMRKQHNAAVSSVFRHLLLLAVDLKTTATVHKFSLLWCCLMVVVVFDFCTGLAIDSHNEQIYCIKAKQKVFYYIIRTTN